MSKLKTVMKTILGIAVTLSAVLMAAVLVKDLWKTYMVSPWTRDGRVLVQVVDAAPEVSGTIVAVPVADNQLVRKGDILFKIDPARYKLALDQAQAQYDTAAEQLKLHESDLQRRQGLVGVLSPENLAHYASDAAVARTALDGARAAVDLARLNLARTIVRSPANGYVTHLRLRPGAYANAGQTGIAVIDSDSFWVAGYFEETKLAQVREGQPARIKLMGYDTPLHGHVESLGRGIGDTNDTTNTLGLPTVSPIFTWVRLAQRLPVRIKIDQIPDGVTLAAGMTASISVGTPSPAPHGKLVNWTEDYL